MKRDFNFQGICRPNFRDLLKWIRKKEDSIVYMSVCIIQVSLFWQKNKLLSLSCLVRSNEMNLSVGSNPQWSDNLLYEFSSFIIFVLILNIWLQALQKEYVSIVVEIIWQCNEMFQFWSRFRLKFTSYIKFKLLHRLLFLFHIL